MEPTARPSVAPQRGADGSPSTSNAWQHPLRPTPPLVRPSPPSQEELRKWIQTDSEVASRLAPRPYEKLLPVEEAKTVIAGKDVEIASLKAELEKVKAQKKSSAASSSSRPGFAYRPEVSAGGAGLEAPATGTPTAEAGCQRGNVSVQRHEGEAVPRVGSRSSHPS
jgi:hypothetical protein